LTLDTGTSSANLNNTSNDFGTVQITSGGAISLVDANAMTLGASALSTITARTLTGDLTLGGNVTAIGSGNSIVLAAANNFLNPGANTLDPGAGRWLVYSTSPAGSTEGGLTAAAGSTLPRLYGKTFSGDPPASIASGNHLVYSSQPTLTVTADSKTKVYGADDPSQTYTASGYINDDGVTDNATAAGLGGIFGRTAGELVSGSPYSMNVGSFASGAGYAIALGGSPTLTINQKSLTASVANQSKTYGADDPALPLAATSLSGLVNATVNDWNGNATVINDSALTSQASTLTRAASETVGAYNITAGTFTAPSANYSAPAFSGSPTLTINQKSLTASVANETKVFGANDPSLPLAATSLTGLVNQTVATWNGNVVVDDSALTSQASALTRAAGETVGAYNITAGTFSAPSANYSAPSFTGTPTLTISQKSLTASVANQSKTYGADDPALPLAATSLTGLINATVNDWNGNATAINDSALTSQATALTRAAGETVGAYNITAGTFSAPSANYSAPGFTGSPTLTINTAALTASVSNQSKTYGADDPALPLAASLTGLVNRTIATWNGNVVVDDSALTSQATALTRAAGETVGAYNITAGTFSAPSANYSAPSFTGSPTLTINQKSLTASVASQTKTYGADDPALPLAATTLTGLVNATVNDWNGNATVINDSALTSQASALTRAAGENVGSYNITAGTFSAPSANYGAPAFAGVPTLTINTAALTASVANQSKTYGANDPSLPLAAPSITGLVNTTVNDWNGSATVINDSALTSNATALTRAAGEDVGNYSITAGTFSAPSANYSAPSFTGSPTLTINPASLTITADDKTRPEATANPPFTATYSGFVSGEGPANLSGSLVLSTPAVVASPPGNYSINPSGHTASNYVIGYVDGVLTVTAVSGGGSTGGGGTSGGGSGGTSGGGTGASSTDALSDAIASQQGRAGERPAVAAPQDAQGRARQIYEVEGTGIRLPPGLQRP
jgi:hypothetical protein